MLKKRGKLRAVVILSFGIIVAILFIAVFFMSEKKENEGVYVLNETELAAYNDQYGQAAMVSYPECAAFIKRNSSLCNKSENREDAVDCISYISMIEAKKYNDVKYCQSISSEKIREYCGMYAKDGLKCELASGDDRQFCLALKNKDTSFCEGLDNNTKNYCIGEVNLILAAVDENPALCRLIPLEWISKYCDAWTSGNAAICSNTFVKTEEVLQNLAIAMANPNICRAINKTKQKEMCFLFFAPAYKDACDKIYTKDIKEACNSIMKNDKSGCLGIADEDAKAVCSKGTH